MASYPDILVTSPDSPQILMAVEARLDRKALEAAIKQLRHYMAKMSCPVGLLVLPDELFIYRNRYTGIEENAIEQIGHYQMGDAFQRFARVSAQHGVKAKGLLFESYVQQWLQYLPQSDDIQRLTPELKDALEVHVLPALESGIVRAAGPREHWSNI
jgi:hypothetical protein